MHKIMDFSKEYIKMCNCEEIQRVHKELTIDNAGFVKKQDDYGAYYFVDNVWLPYQHQLQEMIICDFTIGEIKNDLDSSYIEYYTGKETGAEATSIFGGTTEQRLLRMIMEVNHGAFWTGSKWDRMHWTKSELDEL